MGDRKVCVCEKCLQWTFSNHLISMACIYKYPPWTVLDKFVSRLIANNFNVTVHHPTYVSYEGIIQLASANCLYRLPKSYSMDKIVGHSQSIASNC